MTYPSRACAALLTFASLLAASVAADEPEPQESMVYELRIYTTVEGRLPALHARFRDHTMQLFSKHGIKNVVYWTPLEQENTLVYLIAHASREAADKSWKAFLDDPEWKKAKAESEQDGKIVSGVARQYLTPTDYSPTRSGGFGSLVKDPNLVYELRTYTTNEGKLDALHSRFRDHTLGLFKKHGMVNLIYTTPLDEKTASNTLVYVLAHKDREAAEKSFAAFRNDPAWQQVFQESTKDGKLVQKVDSQFLAPTDYSPVK